MLNQPVRLRFSRSLDPSTVGRPAVRMVDSAGRDVGGRFEVEGPELIYHPRLPRRPDLSDGSLRPGETFRLELAGLPRSYALRDLDGGSLEQSLAFEFEVPERRGVGDELFLATHLPGDLFTLQIAPDGSPPTLAVGGRDLVLDFTLPPVPSTVTREAFELIRLSGGEVKSFRPEAVAVLPNWRPGAPEPGTAVRLTLPTGAEPTEGDKLYLSFEREGRRVLRDFSGRELQILSPTGRPIEEPIEIPSSRLDWRALGLEDRGLAPGFEFSREGKPKPRLRQIAGRGIRGAFVGGPDEFLAAAGSVLEFESFYVPANTRTTIDLGGRSQVLRSLGQVRIDGELVLTNPPAGGEWTETGSLQRVLADAAFSIVAAAPARVRGVLRFDGDEADDPSHRIALIGLVRLELTGELPYGCFIGYERSERAGDAAPAQVIGAAPGNVSGQFELAHGGADGIRGVVRAQTRWIALPEGRDGTLVFSLQSPRVVEVALELGQESQGGGARPRLPFQDGRVVVPPGPETRFRLLLAVEAGADCDPEEFGRLSVSSR